VNILKSELLKIGNKQALGFDAASSSPVTGISTDSRTTQSGDLFFAIRGEKFDGHDFITKAIGSGASVVVVDRNWAESNGAMLVSLNVPRLVVDDTSVALGDLAALYRKSFDIPVIAVAGSNGKTTTKNMIGLILQMKHNILSTEGNLNNHIGVPQTLFRLNKDHDIAVVEIGTNHFGELDYLCHVLAPTHGIITNIGREHLEFFGSEQGVAKAEGELFNWLHSHKGTSFVNSDDPLIKKLTKGARGIKKITFGFRAAGTEVKGVLKGVDTCGCPRLSVRPKGKKPIDIQLKVPGEQNAKNALAAATIGLAFKVGLTSIKKALESFSAAGKRMEVLQLNGLIVLNDTYNANPDSVLAALKTLRSMKTHGRRIAVLADMLELGRNEEREHRVIGKALSEHKVDCLFTYGRLSKHIADSAKVKFKNHFEDKAVLCEQLAHAVASGDIVLVKGSRGMKMEEVVAFLQQKIK
jgi:UDP-N-acetylmuramoyl-tripeptide--D-alanyl-D-alanine ligase